MWGADEHNSPFVSSLWRSQRSRRHGAWSEDFREIGGEDPLGGPQAYSPRSEQPQHQ